MFRSLREPVSSELQGRGREKRTERMVLGSRFHGGAADVTFRFVLLWYDMSCEGGVQY